MFEKAKIVEEFRTKFGTVKIDWPKGVSKSDRSMLLREMADWTGARVVEKSID